MNHYETIFIVDPDTPGTDQDIIFEKVKNMIDQKGKLLMFDDWGNRKLAYEIKKKRQGRYVRLDYCGDGVLVDEMERTFRLDFRILKFMTVLIAQDVDPEALMPVPEPVAEPTVEPAAIPGEENAPAEETVANEAAPETTTETETQTEE
jgi:small subunit ribosomal protein S6